jgi:D-alanyl-D-alanine carboxypeptidase (penicillin-binding protein 5/6)
MVVPAAVAAPPDNTAASWVVQDLDTGAVIAAKDPHARNRPASLIKTLLALVVVKELKPQQVIIPTQEDTHQECTCVGIVAGASYTVDQLLHGLLMHSGNDVAHAFATALGGVPVAVQKMNAMAAKIGAMDTRAATPSGLDGPGMSTSAYDLSLIFNQAMKEPEFANAVGTKKFDFPAIGDKPAFAVYNDNKLLGTYPGFLGGKTGFTDDARHTYVGGAERSGKRIAVVMMRAEQQPTRVVDQAAKLLDYGFSLDTANAPAVGQIVQLAVTSDQPADNPQAPAASPGQSDEGGSGATWWIVALLVIAAIIIAFIVIRRRKLQTEPDRPEQESVNADDGSTKPRPRRR